VSAAALKQYMELANTIASQAEAIAEGKIPGKQLWAQVSGLENNIKTLKAWTPRPEEAEPNDTGG
jgi:hypothetical protein